MASADIGIPQEIVQGGVARVRVQERFQQLDGRHGAPLFNQPLGLLEGRPEFDVHRHRGPKLAAA